MEKNKQEQLDFIKNNYLKKTHREIGNVLNKSEKTIRNICCRNKWRKEGEPWDVIEDDALTTLYRKYKNNLRLNIIAKNLKRTKASIAARANELGITSKNRPLNVITKNRLSKLAKERWKYNPIQAFIKNHQKGRILTQEHKNKVREAGIGRIKRRSSIIKMMKTRHERGIKAPWRGTHTTWKAGKSEDLGDIYFRSRWERNYARYLNFLINKKQIKKWEYEVDVFWFENIKRGVVSYKPDFKIHNNDGFIEYHEIKGWMDKKSITKIKRMAKYYPDIKLYIIDKNIYKEIKNKLSRLIEHWEC